MAVGAEGDAAKSWRLARSARRRTIASCWADRVAASTAEEDRLDAVDRLRRLLRTLPSEQRTLLVLYYSESRSVREIAEVLGIPEGTVKSRLFHARNHLKLRREEGP